MSKRPESMAGKRGVGDTLAAQGQRPTSLVFRICAYCVSDGVPRRSFLVALFVGTLLNVVNQGDVLLDGGNVSLVKMLLTYAVPYGVATYGAVAQRLATTSDRSFAATGGDPPTGK